MVRAILDVRKTQTRRVIKPQPTWFCYSPEQQIIAKRNGVIGWWKAGGITRERLLKQCPYGKPGDVLWVRETLRTHSDEMMSYAAGGASIGPSNADERAWVWKRTINSTVRSIHMPKWACRLRLTVKSVRVERVWDMSRQDAEKEGLYKETDDSGAIWYAESPEANMTKYPKEAFMRLWDSINAKRGYGWDVNPWVWVVEFENGQKEIVSRNALRRKQ